MNNYDKRKGTKWDRAPTERYHGGRTDFYRPVEYLFEVSTAYEQDMHLMMTLSLLVVLTTFTEAAPAKADVNEAFFPVGNYHASASKPGEAIKRSDWMSECYKGRCGGNLQCKATCLSCEGDLEHGAKSGHCSGLGACWCSDN